MQLESWIADQVRNDNGTKAISVSLIQSTALPGTPGSRALAE
jgi:hypothetical protein